MSKRQMKSIVNIMNEVGMLSHIPRSGFAFLGSGKQSVAEHSYRMTLIAFVLARLSPEPVDMSKLLMMCLLHDLPESRIGDLNYVQKKYVQANLEKTLKDIEESSPLGPEIVDWIKEYEEGKTLEAKIAHDADQLELLLVLKQEHELGNPRCMDWFNAGAKRIKSDVGKQLADAILTTPSDEWWMLDKDDPHWVHGGRIKN